MGSPLLGHWRYVLLAYAVVTEGVFLDTYKYEFENASLESTT